ncbi:MAG TPA: tetratricopeptide repeat-containing glycosyltransferase family protein [Polyangia bacterium]|nr:tetratricopeptide repeat-containing glycosyltransferase family protein [Polyangia bacterium]
MAGGFLRQALQAQDRHDHRGALVLFHQALVDEPSNWLGHTGLGNSLRALGKLDEAIAACTRGVEADGQSVPAWTQLGLAYQAKGLFNEARLCLRRVCELRPDSADALANVAAMELLAENFDAAEKAGRQALRMAPGHARAAINLGRACKERGALEEAIALYQRALVIEPANTDARWNLGLALLQDGRWKEGWPLHELRSAIPGPPVWAPGLALWDGRRLGGATVLVQAEKGLGDTIQFARYVRLLKDDAGAGRVIFECQPALEQLMRSCIGIDAVVPRGGPPPDDELDVRVPVLSLPQLLAAFDPAASANEHYLMASAERTAFWKAALGQRQRGRAGAIGIAWQGNPAYLADRRRSLPLLALLPFIRQARERGFAVYSLQKDFGSEQLRSLPIEMAGAVDDLGPSLDGGAPGGAFVDTAAVMANLDLVLSSDTAVPHLAGVLGVPTWLLLSHVPDWRWGRRGAETPWYPSLRLFRQRQAGDWAGVVADACLALTAIERKRA